MLARGLSQLPGGSQEDVLGGARERYQASEELPPTLLTRGDVAIWHRARDLDEQKTMPVKQDDVLPPEEAPDASSKLFREYAAEFAELARNATSADQRILFLKMANIWQETTIRWERDLLKDQEKLRRDNAQEPRAPFPSNTGCALVDQNLIHRIRERAYEIWATNGYRDGEAEQDWLTAEREILDASTATAPKRSAIVADAGVFVA